MKGSMEQTFASKVSVVLKEAARGAELPGPAPACRAEQGAGGRWPQDHAVQL